MKFTMNQIIEMGLIRKRNRCANCGKEMDVPNYHIQLCKRCRMESLDDYANGVKNE